MSGNSKHPNEDMLALYAGGDLEFIERMRVALHVRGCGACRLQLADHQAIRADLASARERTSEPLGDWDRMSDEMTANIRLGISMAECAGPGRSTTQGRRRGDRFSGFFWRPSVMASGAFVLFTGAFVLNMPTDKMIKIGKLFESKDHSGLVLESTATGIEMRRDGRAVISVRHPDRKSHDVAANLDGSMSAGYVDDETGQVTIINVAGQ